MNINELIAQYVLLGRSVNEATNLAAEDIIMHKIAASPLKEKVAFKGGIVMYNLSKDARRVTRDIDFDVIHYSIDEASIRLFVKRLNDIKDGFKLSISKKLEELHQEDYHGVRVFLKITDIEKVSIEIKLDIGVHTYFAIEQKSLQFNFSSSSKSVFLQVNPNEQIFTEKLISLARHGVGSTRYKDIYDMYYLIEQKAIDSKLVRKTIDLMLAHSKHNVKTFQDLYSNVDDALHGKAFKKGATKPVNNWLIADYDLVVSTLLDYIYAL